MPDAGAGMGSTGAGRSADGLAYLGSYASSLSSAVSGTDGPFSFAPCQLPQYDPEPMVAWEG